MATNEDLAIAFLCLSDKKDKDDILHLVEETLSTWEDKENYNRIREAITLPTSVIQRKIALLHTGLYQCPKKKLIYEEMANRLASFTSEMRSPLIKPRNDRSVANTYDSRENIMVLDLGANKTT
jgi:hypothetical protein